MGKVKDHTGERYGLLTAIEYTGRLTDSRSAIWRCVCDCGNEIELPASALVSGNTRSCGCLRNGGVGGGIGGGKPIDEAGKRYGKLVAVKRVGRSKDRSSLWLMKCDCGNECVKDISIVKRGEITSCGCQHKPYDHAHERLHRVYHGMRARCYSKGNTSYPWYGAKGVRVCQEWLDDFASFVEWALANGYDEKAPRGQYTLDRIDPYGNYEPSNCRWLTIDEQQRNKRREV